MATYKIKYTDKTRDIQTVSDRTKVKLYPGLTVSSIKRIG